MNVYTLEQLCALSDTHIKKDRGLFGYREKGRGYLDVSLRGKEASKLQAEKTELENRFKALTNAAEEQAGLIKQLQAQLLSMAQATHQGK